jgi:ribosomal-protein-alanine N-acetyltransferase
MIQHVNSFPTLHTQRLILRALTLQDEQGIFELRSNDTVNQYLDRPKAQSLEDARAFIQRITDNMQKNQSLYWVVALQDDPKLIGTISLWNFTPEHDMAELGYEMLPQYQGQGLMQEALRTVIEYCFTTIQLQTIEAWSHKDNRNSTKLLGKMHFIPKPLQQEDETIPADMVIYRLSKT